MTFLPIVERELRMAARERFAFALRMLAATAALIVDGGYLRLTTVVVHPTTAKTPAPPIIPARE